ncbi:MAG: hypothetical protein IJ736_15895 [Firmicutes bacterium]|nr:hypothetical protein [Bacillota bacterium]
MRNFDVKIKILTDNLDRKKELLKQIEAITEKQEMFFTTLKGEDRNYMLEQAVNEKQKIIDELMKIDEAFLSTFKTFNGELNENRDIYAAEIEKMKKKIKEVTDIDVRIRVREERNRRIFTEVRLENQNQIKGLKASKDYILKQYEKNSKF